jgi:flagellar basal body-associated protein FliL
MVILIVVVIILLVIIVGLLLAWFFAGSDKKGTKNNAEIESGGGAYNLAATMGYKIQVEADPETQMKEARKLAAQKAAATPRWANVQIGPEYKQERQRTAFDGAKDDVLTAVKIAAVHGWDGLQSGIVIAAPAAAPAASAAGKIKLVPGKDYPVIEMTDSMSADEKRKARIANAKAKSVAMKKAKAAQAAGSAAPAATAPAPAAVAAAGIPEPEYVEIRSDMTPEEKRKARIANSKAKSAYNKALKAAGIDLK